MVYRHADGRDPQEVLENVIKYQGQGYLAVRCQLGGYGGRVKDITAATAVPSKEAPQATHRMKKLDRLNTVLQENIAGVATIQAFGQEAKMYRRFQEVNLNYRDVLLRADRVIE